MSERAPNLGERVAGLEATVKGLSIEIRDLKAESHEAAKTNAALSSQIVQLTLQMQPMLASHVQLQKLITEAEQQKGMGKLAKLLFGGGIIASAMGAIGATLAGIYHFFAKGGIQ